jgi:non-reducing end alpha-L-arabinofuranosidase
MKTRIHVVVMLVLALTLIAATSTRATQAGSGTSAPPPRPQGSCDIYAAGGAPCVAAHSTTRALYASYNGPLYQVLRQSDGKTLDIGVVQPSASPVPDPGGYADASAQDAFCANTYCWIAVIYDQSGKGNHLVQAPRGGFSGPAMGGSNNIPIADMAPITIMGHKAYGVFIELGMGLRWNDAKGTAVDDQAEGQYWVVSGHHYNGDCCFDYGNAETDSRDDGNGTMETTYFGNGTSWYHGNPPGPWIMTDQENNIVGCANPDGSKLCVQLPSITWRFVTATADGEPHHWRTMGGDAQRGPMSVMFDGPRINSTYDPMRKQGGILLGNGGDNSVRALGLFYEGAMTAGGTFPKQETNQLIQANVVAAKYDVQRLSLAPASATAAPPGVQTFSPRSSQDAVLTFTNTTGAPVTGLKLSMSVPAGWASSVPGARETSVTLAGPVAPGASASATFRVTSGPAAFNGDLVGHASWTNRATGGTQSETTVQKVRNVSPVKINEFRISSGPPANATDSFIELYNAGASAVDISNWTLTEHPALQPIFSSVKIPAATKLAPGGFYLLGLSNSGLAAPARGGDTLIHVRSTEGMKAGDTVEIGAGSEMETRTIEKIGTAASGATTLWQPLPDGPVVTIPAGSTNVPVASVVGFEVGQMIALGYGAEYPAVARTIEQYEVATVTAVGKPGTQAWLTADAKAGDTNIKVSSLANISAGDKIRLDIASAGHGIETVTVKSVGTQSVRNAFRGPLTREELGTGLELAEPLKFNHSSNMSFSARGTGISFKPATAFKHSSNEPVQALGAGITLDKPLARDHAVNAVVRDSKVTTAGYQGTPAPNQWFGGPELTAQEQARPQLTVIAGSMVLRDGTGVVVDSLNYGLPVDPWAAEGYQTAAGAEERGCFVPAPGSGYDWGPVVSADASNASGGRFPDGFDTDSNCTDFLVHPVTTLSVASAAGAANIKVASVVGFGAGQTVTIDTGANLETAVIAHVGTPGATTVDAATDAGATAIPVAGATGFSVGQTINIDSGAKFETAVVVSVRALRGGPGRGPGRGATITVAKPLTFAHAAGAEVSGTGITVTAALTRAHAGGAQVAAGAPTPGAPNKYYRTRR